MTKAAAQAFVDNNIKTNGNQEITGSKLQQALTLIINAITKSDVGLGNADDTSDIAKPVSTAQAAADTVVLNSAKAYADSLVVGLIDLRGSHDASTNLFPTTGGSGPAGAVMKGDFWFVSVAGNLAGKDVVPGDSFFAKVDSPGQTAGNWNVLETNIGYAPENPANKNAANGYAGLTGTYALQLKNAAGTFTNILGNATTAARTYGLQDRDGTIADDTDISGLQAQIVNLRPQVATVSGTCGEVTNKNRYLFDDTPGNGDFTIDPFGAVAREFRIMRVGSVPGNTMTVKAAAGGSVNGAANFTLAAAYDWADILVPAGSNDCLVFLP